MPSGTENVSYSSGAIIASVVAGQSSTSDQTLTWATTGNVPPGLKLKIIKGTPELTGKPTAWGTYSFSVSVTDVKNYEGTQPFQVTISPAVTFTPLPATASLTLRGGSSSQADTVLPNGVAGTPYSPQTISVTSNSGISLSVTSNSGISLRKPGTKSWNGLSVTLTASNTVIIKGTPKTFTNPTLHKKGSSGDPLELTVTAFTDDNKFSDATTYLINVEPASSSSPVAIQVDYDQTTYNDFPTAATAGQPYSATFVTPTGTGFQFSLMNSSAVTSLGMTFDAALATLSGTPSKPGLYNLVVQAKNVTSGVVESCVFHLTVNPSSPSSDPGITPTPSSGFTPQQIRQAYGLDQITLSGGIIGDGTGQTVVIIDGGDAPNLVSSNDPNYDNSDLHQFNQQFGLPDSPFFKEDAFGGTNIPTSVGDVGETTQDVEWVHDCPRRHHHPAGV